MNLIKSIYKKIFQGKNKKISNKEIIKEWISQGKPLPPPHIVKQETISEARLKYGYKIFIETGTYLGDMVAAQINNFEKIYSIELGNELYDNAVKKFESDKNVTILHGDSGKVFIDLLPQVDKPAVFWLDGHYSEGFTARGNLDTPVLQELELILNHKIKDHIILIDDARCFNGEGDYPDLKYLQNFVQQKNSKLKFTVMDDIIRIHN